MFLHCGPQAFAVDLKSLLPTRLEFQYFEEKTKVLPALHVELVEGLVDGVPFDGNLGQGSYTVVGDRLRIAAPLTDLRGEAIVRLAWAVLTERLGGVLLHASGVKRGDSAVIVCGKSGTGKSTLARHARNAGAQLLSDEIIQWLPDTEQRQGRVWGTPFFSEADLSGGWHSAVPALACTVSHAPHEALAPWPPTEAVKVLMAQLFQAPHQSAVHAAARLMPLLKHVSLGVFSCRNAPEAGAALLSHVPVSR